MWARRLQARAKRLLHNSQACGLSPAKHANEFELSGVDGTVYRITLALLIDG